MTTPTRPRVSCSTASLMHLPLATALGIIRDAGFDGAEFVVSPEVLARKPTTVERIVAQSGVRILSFHPPLYPYPGWPRTQSGRGMAAARGAAALGAEVAVIHAPRSRSLATPRAREYLATIEAARDYLTGHDAVIGLETTMRPWNGKPPLLFDDLEYFTNFAETRDLGVTYDTSHAGANGDDLLADLKRIGARLRNVHFSDAVRQPTGKRPQTHLRPGSGATQLVPFLGELGRMGYRGLVTLEVSPFHLSPWSWREMTRRLTEAREFIFQHMQVVTSEKSGT